MELTFSCPACGTVGQVALLETADRAVCRRCGTDRPLHPEVIDHSPQDLWHEPDEDRGTLLHPEVIDHSRLDACPWCLTTDLYTQKDFPQALGLMIVMFQIGISTVFWYYEKPIETFAVLLTFTLLDWALYPRVPDVTICYRCCCQVRGAGSNVDGRFQPFDLAIGERYRQERIRAQELRERGASAD
jgi:hypothetical protein